MLKLNLLLLVITIMGYSQEYPIWFLEQGKIPCENAVVVMYKPYYTDSIPSLLKKEAKEVFAKQQYLKLKGAWITWSTEAGIYDIAAYVDAIIDSSVYSSVPNDLNIVDIYLKDNTLFALLTKNACDINQSLLTKTTFSEKFSDWVVQIPKDENYYYAIGSSQLYYNEYNSWKEAEDVALKELAKMIKVKISGLGKFEQDGYYNEGDEQRVEEYEAELKNYNVVARTFDKKNRQVYVLLKMPKK